MREAIKHVFPNASHCLCAWHLHKNAYENVKNSNFLQDFKKVLYGNIPSDKFEQFQKAMVAKHNLEGKDWVTQVYN